MSSDANAAKTPPRLTAGAIAAVERILADGGRAEIICGEKTLIVKEVKRKTAHKSALT